MSKNIAILEGDGIGPEIIQSTLKVLDKVKEKFSLDIEYNKYNFGGIAIDKEGDPLPQTTIEGCMNSDAILLGAIGGPKYNECPKRPEDGLLELRKKLELFANLRPVKVYNSLLEKSPLKSSNIKDVDFIIVRELVSGIYFGDHNLGHDEATDICYYSIDEIERLAKVGFELAQKRGKKLVSVDKQNVLATSKLWRKTVDTLGQNYPSISIEHQLVDSMAMFLISNPKNYDVIITENMFGDILSDEASMLSGSLGLMPSASIGVSGLNLYEPIHGSAPDIAGKNIANPIGTIMSLAMLLRMSFDEEEVANSIEKAVEKTLNDEYLTKDLGGDLGTNEITVKIIENIG